MITIFGVDVLFWDEWMIWGKLLEAMKQGGVVFADIVAQQNEQRNAAARIIGLLFMPLFKLNRIPEFYVIILLVTVNFGLLCSMYARLQHRLNLTPRPLGYLIFACATFSVTKWQVFTYGVNTSIAFPITCLVFGVWFAGRGRLSFARWAVLGLVGVMGSFHFANGLFYWFCILPLLWAMEGERKSKIIYSILWIALTAAVWGLYFTNYTKPPHHPSLMYVFYHPFASVGFLFAFLGAGVATDANLFLIAMLLGALGAFFVAAGAWRCREALLKDWQAWAPWAALLLFALMSGGAIMVGRAGMGIKQQAMQSRYIAFSSYFWIASAPLLMLGSQLVAEKARRFYKMQNLFMFACLVFYCVSIVTSYAVIYNRSAKFRTARAQLFELTNDDAMKKIFPDRQYLKKLLPLFFEKRLSVFRDIGFFADYEQVNNAKISGALLQATPMPGGYADNGVAGVLLQGWATAPGYVLIVVEGDIVYATKPKPASQDLPLPKVAQKGAMPWKVFVPSALFGDDIAQRGRTLRIQAYSVLPGGKIVALENETAEVAAPKVAFPPFIVDQHFYHNT